MIPPMGENLFIRSSPSPATATSATAAAHVISLISVTRGIIHAEAAQNMGQVSRRDGDVVGNGAIGHHAIFLRWNGGRGCLRSWMRKRMKSTQ